MEPSSEGIERMLSTGAVQYLLKFQHILFRNSNHLSSLKVIFPCSQKTSAVTDKTNFPLKLLKQWAISEAKKVNHALLLRFIISLFSSCYSKIYVRSAERIKIWILFLHLLTTLSGLYFFLHSHLNRQDQKSFSSVVAPTTSTAHSPPCPSI